MSLIRLYPQFLLILLCSLISQSALSVQTVQECDVNSFQPYWQDVFDTHLTVVLTQQGTPAGQISNKTHKGAMEEANQRTQESATYFSGLLERYPELCQLTRLPARNLYSGVFFRTLIFDRLWLQQAFDRKILSARYLAESAVSNPFFASKLLEQMPILNSRVRSLEVSKKHHTYFDRLTGLLKHPPATRDSARKVYGKAFSHLLLLINESASDDYLDYYSETISKLDSSRFNLFLSINLFSIDAIADFLNQTSCGWYFSGNETQPLGYVCGNTVFTVLGNRTWDPLSY